ncbi:MAG: hypothetical protein Q8O30_02625 [Candidatus Omnitrophota bacterium]|nr:hypothetical protein [Candidatus Omnitrophota bacterium]
MTKKEFLKSVSKEKKDTLQQLLDLLADLEINYCVIGGLGVNAYVEPVVSLDLDIVIVAEALEDLIKAVKKIFKIERFTHSVNLGTKDSDLRIQIQTDARYQDFIPRAHTKEVVGYKMKVASLPDILQGKIWAYSDEKRRKSKRQKDLADIFRIIEKYPRLKTKIPQTIKDKFI